MKSTILKKLRQLYHKNPYVKESFPYDMRKAKEYADSIGKRLHELSDSEMSKFLIK